jgi:hypothetical protein
MIRSDGVKYGATTRRTSSGRASKGERGDMDTDNICKWGEGGIQACCNSVQSEGEERRKCFGVFQLPNHRLNVVGGAFGCN